ncbi:MAG: hypothetical protein ABIG89_02795 [Candidatus Woesearchaeota archaeon]
MGLENIVEEKHGQGLANIGIISRLKNMSQTAIENAGSMISSAYHSITDTFSYTMSQFKIRRAFGALSLGVLGLSALLSQDAYAQELHNERITTIATVDKVDNEMGNEADNELITGKISDSLLALYNRIKEKGNQRDKPTKDKCDIKIISTSDCNNLEGGKFAICRVKVDRCGYDWLVLEHKTDAIQVSEPEITKEGDIWTYEYTFDLKNYGWGENKYRRTIKLMTDEGFAFDRMPKEEGDKEELTFKVPETIGYALGFGIETKLSYGVGLLSNTDSTTIRKLPVNRAVKRGANTASTGLDLSVNFTNPRVHTKPKFWWGLYFNNSEWDKDLSFGGLFGFQMKNEYRTVPFGFGIKLGGHLNKQYDYNPEASNENDTKTINMIDFGFMFFGDELYMGDFSSPLEDFEYQLDIISKLIISSDSDNNDGGNFYVNANVETLFDIGRAGPFYLLGAHLGLHSKIIGTDGSFEEGNSINSEQKQLWVIVGPKFRFETEKAFGLRVDLKPSYFFATKFNTSEYQVHGMMLMVDVEYFN